MGFFSKLFGRPLEEKRLVKLAGSKIYSTHIVGESNYQHALESVCGGRTFEGHEMIVEATLIHEDNNLYDKNAIRVDIEGKTVGYLSRENAKNYRARLTEKGYAGSPATCSAKITGGWDRGNGDRGHFGVRLDIPLGKQYRSSEERKTEELEFRFTVFNPNKHEICNARIGESVNFWTPPDSQSNIFIYRSSGPNEGKLGLVPNTYVERIVNHRIQGLPIKAKIVELSETSCTIQGRLVSIEEVEELKQKQREKLREEFKKPYNPKKPVEFTIETKSGTIKVGDRFKLSRVPSIDDCIKDINKVVFIFSSVDRKMIIEKRDHLDVKKKLVLLVQKFGDNLVFEVISSRLPYDASDTSIYTLQTILPKN